MMSSRATRPTHAIVLAAGLGRRMQASDNDPPKPLTEIGGITLLDRMLTRLADFGVTRVVINLHHKPEMIEAHLLDADYPFEIVFSDERACLMETGGGVLQALHHLGDAPFFVCNADVLWLDNAPDNTLTALDRLAGSFDPDQMDACLLLAARDKCSGYEGAGDFTFTSKMDISDGKIERLKGEQARAQSAEASFAPVAPQINAGVYAGFYVGVYAGVQIVSPSLFDKTPDAVRSQPFSFNILWDEALVGARLFGCSLDGTWLHVGTPEGVRDAERILQEKNL